MLIRSYRPWTELHLPAHHEVVQAFARHSVQLLSGALPLVQDVVNLLNEHRKNDPTLRSLKFKKLHQILSERALRTLQLSAQCMDALSGSAASGPRVALQIASCTSGECYNSGEQLASDLATVVACMRAALAVRRICETSEGSIEFTGLFSLQSKPQHRVPIEGFEKAVRAMPQLYLWLAKHLRETREVCRRLVKANPFVLAFFSDELLHDEPFVRALVQDCAEPGQAYRLPRVLAMLPQRWKEHPEIAALCVRIWWTSLPQLGESLLSDRDWVVSILPSDSTEDEEEQSASYGVASEIRAQLVSLRSESDHEDWPYLQQLVGERAQAWAALPETFRGRKEVAELLLESDCDAEWVHEQIALLSTPLRSDKQLARAFLGIGAPLRAWDESLWRDPELAMLDLLSADSEENYLDMALAGNRDLALEVVTQRPDLLREFLPEVRQDPQVMARALTSSPFALELASDSQRSSVHLIQPAVCAWGTEAFRLAGVALRSREAGPEAEVLLRELLSCSEGGLALSLAAEDSLRYDPALRALARDKPEGFEPKQYALFQRDTPFNRERWSDLIEMDWMSFAWAPNWVRRDRAMTMRAVRLCMHQGGVDRSGEHQPLAPTDLCHPDLQADPTFWKDILTEFASPERAKRLWHMLMAAPEAVRNNPDVLVILLLTEPTLWKRLAREVRRNRLLVDAMIPLKPEMVAREFYDDEAIMQQCCQQRALCFQFGSKRLRSAGPFANEWVSKKPRLFRHLTQEARADLATVRIALASDWRILAQASESIRADPETIQLGMRQHPVALAYAARSLRENPAFLMDCLRKGLSLAISMEDRLADGTLATHYEPTLRFSLTAQSPEFWMAALRELGPSCLAQAPIALHRHADLMREAIRLDRSAIEMASSMLRADPSFMLDVLVQDPGATQFLHGSLARDPSFQKRVAEVLGGSSQG